MLRVQRELEGTVYVVVYIFKMFEVYYSVCIHTYIFQTLKHPALYQQHYTKQKLENMCNKLKRAYLKLFQMFLSENKKL